MSRIQKVLVANRGEIAIRIFRACHELNIQTIGIYSKEDVDSLHRQHAKEAYLIGEELDPVEAYLAIDEIIALAKEKGADAIHPGYGFLSENEEFARRCQEEGIIFVGPELKHLEMFGNKTRARQTAVDAGLPIIPGTIDPVESIEEVEAFIEAHGLPVLIKAVSGGGGKGMRLVESLDDLPSAYQLAKSEALKSFGDDRLYVERYIQQPKHIEVQILGDTKGHVVHLYERDCSIQRRHQKVVEVAPSFGLCDSMRKRLTEAAVQLMSHVDYVNAGTVEFLVSGDDFYFIEVNPRVQVEHTITELVTGVDIVKAQLLIAAGESLHGDKLRIPEQEAIPLNGYAIQCRITTEDPLNQFAPDTGRIVSYQSTGGFGIRLDAGNAYQGSIVTPYYDSLLVKISTHGMDPKDCIDKMSRALADMEIRGIKTNIRFLSQIINHPLFLTGDYDTTFIDTHPELFNFIPERDRRNKILKYLANVTVNGFPGIADNRKPAFEQRSIPTVEGVRQVVNANYYNRRSQTKAKRRHTQNLTTKEVLDQKGPQAVQEMLLQEPEVWLTDTTLRDAHQALLTTRMRTYDMLQVAPFMNETLRDYFSIEMWGGATFDVAYNFLRESPWHRLRSLRQAMPDLAFQMLLRASNAVGYTNYPDNVVTSFIETSAKEGIDVFRIFDSLNWLEAMKLPIEAALETGKLVEGTICYTGDVLNTDASSVYTLDYYTKLAKELESLGVHTLAIKDMSGILKPEAAYQLISALKETVKLPIHLHTHDTAGNALQTYSRAIDAGVNIVDTANQAISGLIAQPNANSLYFARQGTDRQIKTNLRANEALANYWRTTRQYYKDFETEMKSPWVEVYEYEAPGGQYSNLQMQATSMGLGNRFGIVLDMYRRVNQLFGDIVKVTPSSKVVGDMALFMVQNDLDEQSVIERGMNLDFPQSVVSFFRGEIGQPAGGMNKELQRVVLKGEEPYTDRPGNHLDPFDFKAAKESLDQRNYQQTKQTSLLSQAMYPKVYGDYLDFIDDYGIIDVLETPAFFYGLELGEQVVVELEPGNNITIKLRSIGPLEAGGKRMVYFTLNGMSAHVEVDDLTVEEAVKHRPKADRQNPNQIGAQMPGKIVSIEVQEGDTVKQSDLLIVTEAMKMETTILAQTNGVIKRLLVDVGDQIEVDDLLVEIESQE